METLYSIYEESEAFDKSEDHDTRSSLLIRCKDTIESLHVEIEDERQRRRLAEAKAKELQIANDALEQECKNLQMRNAVFQHRLTGLERGLDDDVAMQLEALEAKYRKELSIELAQRLADKAKYRDLLRANKEALKAALAKKNQELYVLKQELSVSQDSPLGDLTNSISDIQQRMAQEVDYLKRWRQNIVKEQHSEESGKWYRHFMEALTHVRTRQVIGRLESLRC
jgi:FtsZ-binding cell division protein ZapB